MSSSVSKIVAERSRRILLELVLRPGNDVCADCKARAPRWASYNLGIFICVSCASIHRKIGTHVTKVKSITLDEWSKEQVEVMKEKGNIKSNALYNPDEARHPPPTNMIDSERDSELEKFIRWKYEFKRFIDRQSGPTSKHLMADPATTSTIPRLRSAPLTDFGPPPPPKTPENLPSSLRSVAAQASPKVPPARCLSQPLPPLTNTEKLTTAAPLKQPAAIQSSIEKPVGQVWEDLISLQDSRSSSLPLQYSPVPPVTPFPSQPQVMIQPPTTLGNAQNPFMNLSLGQASPTTPIASSPISMSTPGPQFPFVPPAPISSSTLHIGAMNPFSQTPLAANTNDTVFSTNSNPFSASPMPMPMTTSAIMAPSMQPVMGLQTGALLHTPPVPYVTSQMSTPAPAVSFPPTPFTTDHASVGLVQNPFAPVGALGQVQPLANGSTNPFSAMHIGQAGFSGAVPQTGFATTAFVSQQQQQLGPNTFSGWAGQGAQGTF